MKKSSIFIAIAVLALCLVGWLVLVTQKASEKVPVDDLARQADEWTEKGLYQRAIANYQTALDAEPSKALYEKILNAYQLRYAEAPEQTEDDFVSFLCDATGVYPAKAEFVDPLVAIYQSQDDVESAYSCLKQAIANGYDDESVRAKFLATKYAWELRAGQFAEIKASASGIYATNRDGKWNLFSNEDGELLDADYNYVGLCSADGIVAATGEDSRLITTDGMVLGIFGGNVTDAGIYADGLIPACVDGVYGYYDEFAEKQLGEFEMAGVFQNEAAAVKADGKWKLINKKGKSESDTFDEIVLDNSGRYLVGDRILVKDGETYKIYDKDWKKPVKLDCSDTDILTADGCIAVCENGKWGFVDAEGKTVIKPTYDEAKSFSNGLAAVRMGNLWGFINRDNQLVIDYQFADAGYMDANGICPVRTDLPQQSATQTEPAADKNAEDTNQTENAGEKPAGETAAQTEQVPPEWCFLQLRLGIVTE